LTESPLLAKLCARAKIEVVADSNTLEDSELEKALRNTRIHADLVIRPQIDFTASQVRNLKEFFGEFFDAPPKSGEAKSLGQETGLAIQKIVDELTPLLSQTIQYPFLSQLTLAMDKLKEVSGKSYTWYLTDLKAQAEDLLDIKEDTLDPIRTFMSGPQKDIFDDVTKFIQTQEPNFTYLDSNANQLKEKISDLDCLKGNNIQQLKTNLDLVKQEVKNKVQEEIDSARKKANILQKQLEGMKEFAKLADKHKDELLDSFKAFNSSIKCQNLIAVIRDHSRTFEEVKYQSLLSRISEITRSKEATSDPGTPAKPKIEYVFCRSIQIAFEKAWLADESDVELYLESMREALLAEINKGNRIQI